MRLTVRLFAGLKERAGAPTVELELPDPATVADVRTAFDAELPYIVAVNRVYARDGEPVGAGDEVALIPPVSGGESAVRHVRITAEPIAAGPLIELVRDPRAGAVVVFEGVTREVSHLVYEAYAEMAEPMLRTIAAEEAERHGLVAVAVEHRIGTVSLSEPSVIVAAAGPHREHAFAGARAVIDRLKAEAPIFKQEEARWVEGTLPDPGRMSER
ncbi:MAG: MoaE-MoaD fusion protein [Solirubrobacteraceae bacterium]|jgi:molybdopterin synthase catalytic subunit|nr:MoaE-MoaD fusion protein [Solirubrobacteraceae bacterium]